MISNFVGRCLSQTFGNLDLYILSGTVLDVIQVSLHIDLEIEPQL